MINNYTYESELGQIFIEEENNHITKVSFDKGSQENSNLTPLIKRTINELEEYFNGKRIIFTIPIAPRGTEFQQKVWSILKEIPYGKTVSYLDIAKELGCNNKVRAVGNANGKNPILFIIPCHRVINHNGKLGGYAGGLLVKEKLLKFESDINVK